MKIDIEYQTNYSSLYNEILNNLYSTTQLIEDIVKNKPGTCFICGGNGLYVIDPFSYDVYDKTIYMCLCENCYKEREEDI